MRASQHLTANVENIETQHPNTRPTRPPFSIDRKRTGSRMRSVLRAEVKNVAHAPSLGKGISTM